ncbi:hypothetical protein V8G54_004832, partial [Vigna mungo]
MRPRLFSFVTKQQQWHANTMDFVATTVLEVALVVLLDSFCTLARLRRCCKRKMRMSLEIGFFSNPQPLSLIEVGGGRWSVLEPCHLQVGFHAHHTIHSEQFLALTDEEKSTIHELSCFMNSPTQPTAGFRDGIHVDNVEVVVFWEECVHHDAVTELEDARMEPGKSTKRRGKGENSTTSSELKEFVWCFSDKEEEQRKVESAFGS